MPVPTCTGTPEACKLCDLIGMIYEDFPAEADPGCETAASDNGEAT